MVSFSTQSLSFSVRLENRSTHFTKDRKKSFRLWRNSHTTVFLNANVLYVVQTWSFLCNVPELTVSSLTFPAEDGWRLNTQFPALSFAIWLEFFPMMTRFRTQQTNYGSLLFLSINRSESSRLRECYNI